MASPAMQLPPTFVDSCLQHYRFPLSVASKTAYGSSLVAYYNRLHKHAPRLFIDPDDESFVIPFKEVTKNANGEWVITKYNALDGDKLKLRLGDTTKKDPNNPAKLVGAFATRPDPRCRIIFVVSESALAPLNLTQDALLRILTYHQVMPAYIDFLLVYGTRDEDRELRFTGFRSRTTLQNPLPGCTIADLHRSGRQHELCYNLKAVAVKESGKSQQPRNRWKIRQAAIYHRFDLGSGTALWIIGDPRETVKNDLKDVLPEGPVPSEFNFGTVHDAFMASLDTHLVLVNWASASWRWHIQDLEETIDDMTRPAILFDYESRDQPEVAPRAVTLVQEYEDKVNETLMVIEANLKIFSSLLTSYTALVEDKNFPLNERDACKAAVGVFSTKIEEYAYDLRMQADRARVLSKVATDRKNIVLQQLQTQTAIKQEALASSMWAFSNNSQKETIAMRIITAITLLYLPPTFVCTFFGTDVIKYQDNGKGSVYFSIEALKSFLYVTVPLWVITVAVVYYLNKTETKRRGRSAMEMVSKYPVLWTPSSTSTASGGLKGKGI
ncbi:hypothetical protein FJTKL_00228 [Diaporthe vaccinii]|uniref:CorA-like transporter domain-containing protein n=1 Tax=Diaporthe vaccinii TaxID=105482 RepID=A0ABR4E3T5_9PEZI